MTDSNFRRHEPEEVIDRERGIVTTIQLCEEYDPESGRWEPFYTTIDSRWIEEAN